MRIVLINPPASNKNSIAEHGALELGKILDERKLTGPPYALISLAGNLADHEVELLDLKAEFDLGNTNWVSYLDFVASKAEQFKPEMVGITFIASDYPQGISIFQRLKALDPKIVTVAGGIQVTLAPEDFNLPDIDFLITGPGKEVFRRLVNQYETSQNWEGIPNLIRVQEGGLYHNPKTTFLEPDLIRSQTFANRNLVKKYDQAYLITEVKLPVTFLETSYGCPAKCTFCSIWPARWR